MTTQARDGVIVRPAIAADVPALEAMGVEFQDYINGLSQPGAAPEPSVLTAAAIRRHGFGADPWFHGLLAEIAGEPAGYMLYYFGFYANSATGALVVADLFVRQAARGRGVGTALMTEATRILRRRGGQTVLWTVWDRNPAAIAFYQRLGVNTISEEIIMEWPETAWPGG